MSSTLNDTMGTAKHVVDSAKEGAEHAMRAAKGAMESAKEGTGHAVSSVRSTFLDGVQTVASVVSMLRGLDLDDGLGWIGLARRRSPFESVAIFGAGLAVGAGFGMLFAPTSGADARRAILERLGGLKREANEAASRVESGAKEVEQKAERLAGKAKDAVIKAEHKVEDKVSDGAEAVKDAVKSKAESAVGAVKSAAEDAKLLITPTEAPLKNSTGTEANRPGRPHGGPGGGERFS